MAGVGSRYSFYIVTGKGDDTATCARDTANDTASVRCDTAGLDHDTVPMRSMTRRKCAPRHGAQCAACTRPGRSVRSAWAQCARSLGLGCASCAPNPVLTSDTVFSHCLRHCSWALFMNTVHRVLKKKITKILKIFLCMN